MPVLLMPSLQDSANTSRGPAYKNNSTLNTQKTALPRLGINLDVLTLLPNTLDQDKEIVDKIEAEAAKENQTVVQKL